MAIRNQNKGTVFLFRRFFTDYPLTRLDFKTVRDENQDGS